MFKNRKILPLSPLDEKEDQKRPKRSATPLVETDFSEADRKRFWAKVKKAGPEECWEWQACRTSKGYGHFENSVKGRRFCLLANRVALLLSGTPLDASLFVMHSCDNPPCCNPAHLSLGTNADNMRDAANKGFFKGERVYFRGTANGVNRLNVEQVREIRKLSHMFSRIELAKKYSVSPGCIYDITSFTTWSWLDPEMNPKNY